MKKKRENGNGETFIKLRSRSGSLRLIAYCLLIIIIFTLDYFGIPEDKSVTTGQEPCGVMGDEVVTMNECYDIMLNEL
jgi:hypothetical protein